MHTMAVVVPAAGQGTRAAQGVAKQFAMVHGKPLLWHTLNNILQSPVVSHVVVVLDESAQAQAQYAAIIATLPHPHKLLPWVLGGAQRHQSVHSGLQALALLNPQFVAVHDAARPWLSANVLQRLANAVAPHTGVVPVLPVRDTMRYITAQGMQTAERQHLHAIQTPQVFCYASLCHAYAQWPAEALATDDAEVFAAAGYTIHTVTGDRALHKYTDPADFTPVAAPDIRTGLGFDVHAFDTASSGNTLWLGGVAIEHTPLLGHSDADVLLHALTDAILGAAGAGDIGVHFPPSDAQWRGAASAQFVTHALTLLQQAGGRLNHIDVTVMGETPKITPHRTAIGASLAQLCGIDVTRCNVKATTTEKLGFLGRREGLAAQAIVTAVF